MSIQIEFIPFAPLAGANLSQLCCRFGIGRKAGCQWSRRYPEAGESCLA